MFSQLNSLVDILIFFPPSRKRKVIEYFLDYPEGLNNVRVQYIHYRKECKKKFFFFSEKKFYIYLKIYYNQMTFSSFRFIFFNEKLHQFLSVSSRYSVANSRNWIKKQQTRICKDSFWLKAQLKYFSMFAICALGLLNFIIILPFDIFRDG